jgi:hypothetical protein
MHRTIAIDGTEYTAELGTRQNYRVAIKDGMVYVSEDLDTRTPGAECEAVFYGRERVEIITAPESTDESEGYEIGPLSEPTLEDIKAIKRAEIANARWSAEVGGVEVGGISIDTSRESQALITGAALQAMIDKDYVCQWKTAAGFVTLDAEAIMAVAVAVREHVQECFNREAALSAEVEAAETAEEVEGIEW